MVQLKVEDLFPATAFTSSCLTRLWACGDHSRGELACKVLEVLLEQTSKVQGRLVELLSTLATRGPCLRWPEDLFRHVFDATLGLQESKLWHFLPLDHHQGIIMDRLELLPSVLQAA